MRSKELGPAYCRANKPSPAERARVFLGFVAVTCAQSRCVRVPERVSWTKAISSYMMPWNSRYSLG
jgi:hypothetical protein